MIAPSSPNKKGHYPHTRTLTRGGCMRDGRRGFTQLFIHAKMHFPPFFTPMASSFGLNYTGRDSKSSHVQVGSSAVCVCVCVKASLCVQLVQKNQRGSISSSWSPDQPPGLRPNRHPQKDSITASLHLYFKTLVPSKEPVYSDTHQFSCL